MPALGLFKNCQCGSCSRGMREWSRCGSLPYDYCVLRFGVGVWHVVTISLFEYGCCKI